MTKFKLGQDPAFPIVTDDMPVEGTSGISKRLYIATKCMQGILANTIVAKKMGEKEIPHPYQIEAIAKASFKYTDELLKQEDE